MIRLIQMSNLSRAVVARYTKSKKRSAYWVLVGTPFKGARSATRHLAPRGPSYSVGSLKTNAMDLRSRPAGEKARKTLAFYRRISVGRAVSLWPIAVCSVLQPRMPWQKFLPCFKLIGRIRMLSLALVSPETAEFFKWLGLNSQLSKVAF